MTQIVSKEDETKRLTAAVQQAESTTFIIVKKKGWSGWDTSG